MAGIYVLPGRIPPVSRSTIARFLDGSMEEIGSPVRLLKVAGPREITRAALS
jgi:hypothetical protein